MSKGWENISKSNDPCVEKTVTITRSPVNSSKKKFIIMLEASTINPQITGVKLIKIAIMIKVGKVF